MSEIIRRENARTKVLAKFQGSKRVTNVELNEICFRFGARIEELRKAGYDIETGKKVKGVVTYEYRGVRSAPVQERLGL